MKELFEGVKNFTNKEFYHNEELFSELKDKQMPHTLFIGCSDSRVVPNLITNSLPGDLFIVRNIANIVPHYRQSDEYLATTSAIEYAVKVLNVENIVICGHSNCGGCKALYLDDDFMDEIPHTKKWLELAEAAKTMSIDQVELNNIVLQMDHLLSYPYIEDRYKNKKIQIFGWYYDIEDGKVYNYNKNHKEFELIK